MRLETVLLAGRARSVRRALRGPAWRQFAPASEPCSLETSPSGPNPVRAIERASPQRTGRRARLREIQHCQWNLFEALGIAFARPL